MEYIKLAPNWLIPKQLNTEPQRLAELRRLQLLDTNVEPLFEDITRTLAQTFHTPFALISLVDKDRQWFKSCFGLDAEETSRQQSFCDHAVHSQQLLLVPDAREDERFGGNTLVTGEPHIRFYAGAPLITRSGFAIGSLCVIDQQPRYDFGEEQQQLLVTMAKLLIEQFELRLLNIKQERLHQAKSNFLSTMSHEIRTPMNGVIAGASLLRKTPVSTKQDEYLKIILSSGRLVLSVLDEILDYAKIESGKVDIQLGAINIRDLIAEQIAMMSVLAQEKHQQLKVKIDQALAEQVEVDRFRLQQILTNLLGNAIKFSPDKGEITLQVICQGEMILFEVIDSGPGISSTALQDIFIPFEQIMESQRYSKKQGTGLGLSICKFYVELMGGSIGVDSQLEAGSRFYFTVPLHEVAATTDTTSAIEAGTLKAEEQIAAAPRADSAHSLPAVLLAEDIELNRYVVEELASSQCSQLDMAVNGVECVAKAKQGRYQIILMDCHMPEMDGFEATRQIRALTDISQPYIIALSASTLPEDRQRCLQAGMDDFLAKPLDDVALQEVLQRYNRPRP